MTPAEQVAALMRETWGPPAPIPWMAAHEPYAEGTTVYVGTHQWICLGPNDNYVQELATNKAASRNKWKLL